MCPVRPSLQPLVHLLFEFTLAHATFAIQHAKLRHEFRCNCFRNGDVVAKRVDANLADMRPLLKKAHKQCSVLSPLHEHLDVCSRNGSPPTQQSACLACCLQSRCRLELFARDVGHCVLEPVGPTCHR